MDEISVGTRIVRDMGLGEYEQRYWIFHDDEWRYIINTVAMRRSSQVPEQARVQDKVADLKAIAKIPP
jgi:hypothetical protein